MKGFSYLEVIVALCILAIAMFVLQNTLVTTIKTITIGSQNYKLSYNVNNLLQAFDKAICGQDDKMIELAILDIQELIDGGLYTYDIAFIPIENYNRDYVNLEEGYFFTTHKQVSEEASKERMKQQIEQELKLEIAPKQMGLLMGEDKESNNPSYAKQKTYILYLVANSNEEFSKSYRSIEKKTVIFYQMQ